MKRKDRPAKEEGNGELTVQLACSYTPHQGQPSIITGAAAIKTVGICGQSADAMIIIVARASTATCPWYPTVAE
jgi:hypothetical protein